MVRATCYALSDADYSDEDSDEEMEVEYNSEGAVEGVSSEEDDHGDQSQRTLRRIEDKLTQCIQMMSRIHSRQDRMASTMDEMCIAIAHPQKRPKPKDLVGKNPDEYFLWREWFPTRCQ